MQLSYDIFNPVVFEMQVSCDIPNQVAIGMRVSCDTSGQVAVEYRITLLYCCYTSLLPQTIVCIMQDWSTIRYQRVTWHKIGVLGSAIACIDISPPNCAKGTPSYWLKRKTILNLYRNLSHNACSSRQGYSNSWLLHRHLNTDVRNEQFL